MWRWLSGCWQKGLTMSDLRVVINDPVWGRWGWVACTGCDARGVGGWLPHDHWVRLDKEADRE
jgi:hypothetical protein